MLILVGATYLDAVCEWSFLPQYRFTVLLLVFALAN